MCVCVREREREREREACSGISAHACVCMHIGIRMYSGVTQSLLGGGRGGQTFVGEGGGARGQHRNEFFSHHIYCAQVKWGPIV